MSSITQKQEWHQITKRSFLMVKVIAYSVVAVLLVASTASAQLGGLLQGTQNWNTSLGSTVSLSGAANTGGTLLVGADVAGQTATTTLGTSASQGLGLLAVQGALGQNNTAAIVSADQKFAIVGVNVAGSPTQGSGPFGQSQLVSADNGSTLGVAGQFEGVSVGGSQTVGVAGNGSMIALNAGATVLGQEVANTSTTADQGVLIIAGALSGITGDAGSKGTVTTTVSSTVVQQQAANGTVVAP
jgi:hypothetical protein